MDQQTELIHDQIEDTRSAMTLKLQSLEREVTDTVQTAKAAVTDTIATVKTAMHDTAESVRHTFDLKRQVHDHPWAMLGGSVAAGLVLGSLFPRGRNGSDRSARAVYVSRPTIMGNGVQHRIFPEPPARSPQPAGPGVFSQLTEHFHAEIEQLKSLAIGTAAGIIRDALKKNLPTNLASQVGDVMDSATVKLGGEPVAEACHNGSGQAFQR